jgi:hypothetical protein
MFHDDSAAGGGTPKTQAGCSSADDGRRTRVGTFEVNGRRVELRLSHSPSAHRRLVRAIKVMRLLFFYKLKKYRN